MPAYDLIVVSYSDWGEKKKADYLFILSTGWLLIQFTHSICSRHHADKKSGEITKSTKYF